MEQTKNSLKQFLINFDTNRITHYQPIIDRNGKNTGKAILTFGTCEPPLFIQGNNHMMKPVEPLLYRPVRCNKCQELGHRAAKCRSKVDRCMKCDGEHMTSKCMVNFYIRPFVCHNCRDNHTANFPRCPAWLRYKQEIQLKKTIRLRKHGKIGG